MIFRKLCGLFVVLFFSQTMMGQRIINHNVEESLKGVIYKQEWSMEMALHHNGFYIGYNSAKIYSFRKTNFYHMSIGYMKDGREINQNKNYAELGVSKSFSYGRQNLFFPIRIAKGTKHYLSEKYTKKGIALAYSYRYGPTIGLLKPTYLQFYNFKDGVLNPNLETIKYSEDKEGLFLNYDRIYGGAGFAKGWNEIRMIPGIHGNFALHFAMGAYGKYVRAMELGLMGDIYIKKIPIMVEAELIHNKPYFLKLYVNLQMGVRSN